MKTSFFVSCPIVCLGYYEVTAKTATFLHKDQQLHNDVIIASAIDTTNGHNADMNSVAFQSAERQLKTGKDDKSTKTSEKQKETKKPKTQGTMEPENQNTKQPGNQGSTEPETQGTMEPRNQATTEPRNQETEEPMNQGTRNPENQAVKKAGNQ